MSNQKNTVKEKGYEALQPTVLGGVTLWTTDYLLFLHITNKWNKQAKNLYA